MTDKEWQELARETKNNKTYFMLIKALTHFAENQLFGTKNKSVVIKNIIKSNDKVGIKSWYRNYYFFSVYQKR